MSGSFEFDELCSPDFQQITATTSQKNPTLDDENFETSQRSLSKSKTGRDMFFSQNDTRLTFQQIHHSKHLESIPNLQLLMELGVHCKELGRVILEGLKSRGKEGLRSLPPRSVLEALLCVKTSPNRSWTLR